MRVYVAIVRSVVCATYSKNSSTSMKMYENEQKKKCNWFNSSRVRRSSFAKKKKSI